MPSFVWPLPVPSLDLCDAWLPGAFTNIIRTHTRLVTSDFGIIFWGEFVICVNRTHTIQFRTVKSMYLLPSAMLRKYNPPNPGANIDVWSYHGKQRRKPPNLSANVGMWRHSGKQCVTLQTWVQTSLFGTILANSIVHWGVVDQAAAASINLTTISNLGNH